MEDDLFKEDVVDMLYKGGETTIPSHHTLTNIAEPRHSNTGHILLSKVSYEQLTRLFKFGEIVFLLVGAA